MNTNELLALASDPDFRGRLKFVVYRKAVEIRKDAGASTTAKALAAAILADIAPLERIALAALTQPVFGIAPTYSEVSDSDIEAAAIFVIPAFI